MIKQVCSTIALLIGIVVSIHAQFYRKDQIDSLQAQLTHQSGIEKVKTLLYLSEAYHEFQLDSTVHYANRAREHAVRLNYDWGDYKSRYCKARADYHNIHVNEVKRVLIEECIPWFTQNGYSRDALYAELLYAQCLEEDTSGTVVEKQLLRLIHEAEHIEDHSLSGALWYELHMIRAMQLTGKKNQESLDSALFYFKRSKDSCRIVSSLNRKLVYELGHRETPTKLKKQIAKAKRWGNERLITLITTFLAYNYGIQRNDSAAFFLKESRELCSLYGNKRYRAKLMFLQGYVAAINKQHVKALEVLKELEELDATLGSRFPILSNTLLQGMAYKEIGENEKAIKNYIIALKMAQQIRHQKYTRLTYVSLGNLYLLVNDFQKAEQIFKESLSFTRKYLCCAMQRKDLGSIYRNLGLLYKKQKEYQKAILRLDSAKQYLERSHRMDAEDCVLDKMAVYLDMDSINQAQHHMEWIIARYKKYARTPNDFFYLQAGRLNFAQKRYRQAISNLQLFLEKSELISISEDRKRAYNLLYRASKEIGEYEQALTYHEVLKNITDSIKSANAIENIQLIQSKYEVAEREADLLKVKQEKALQELILQRKDDELAIGRLSIVLLVVLILLIGGIVFWWNRRLQLKKERDTIRVEAEKVALEHQRNKAQQEVELAKLKDDLFANVSHELRTPLTLIQVPVKNYLKKVAKEDRPVFQSVLNNTNQLLQLIDEILELSQLESGHLTLQKSRFELREFIVQLKAGFEPLFKQKDIAFKVVNEGLDWSVEADHNRLKMVANNLLKNAYHHCPEKGTIALKLERNNGSNSQQFSFSVFNTGSAIPVERARRIFDRHYRGTPNGYTGNGIGLALSRQIVELHGGELKLDQSQRGKTGFRALFPSTLLHKSGELTPKNNDAAIKEESIVLNATEAIDHRPHVLIVEDHKEMQSLLVDLLQDDFKLHIAQDGVEGEQMALEHQPHLILSDVMMPNKDGFELLQSIKNNVQTSHIPIVLLTARVDIDSKIKGFDQDADDYIGKPFDPDGLKSRIHNLLRLRKQQQEQWLQNPFSISNGKDFTTLDQVFLKKATQVLEENYSDGKFTLMDFCSALALNRNSVHNKLKALTNQSTAQFIRNFRLNKALTLLSDETISMVAIGERTGFNSPQAFNKAFRERFQMTPTTYRKQNIDFSSK